MVNEFNLYIGQRVKRLRLENGLSSREAGELLGVKPRVVTDIEIGTKLLTPELLIRMSEIYGTTCESILGMRETGDPMLPECDF